MCGLIIGAWAMKVACHEDDRRHRCRKWVETGSRVATGNNRSILVEKLPLSVVAVFPLYGNAAKISGKHDLRLTEED